MGGNKMKLKLFIGVFLLLCLVVTGFLPTIAAANGLEFVAEKVYYTDNSTLAVEGSFHGWPDDRPYASGFKVFVSLHTDKGWKAVSGYAVTSGIPKPEKQTLYIYNVKKTSFSDWKTTVDY
jgi:hypothetical protein